MGFLSKLGHFAGHLFTAGADVLTGHPLDALGQVVQSTGLIPSGAPQKPKLVKSTGGAYPGAIPRPYLTAYRLL